jgi:hypothetical protein
MSNRASVVVGRLLRPDRGRAVLPSRNQSGVVAFKGGEFSGEELAFGDQDDVQTRSGFVTPIEFSRQALGSIANNRTPQPARGGDSEATRRQSRAKQEYRHEPTAELETVLVDALEVSAPPDAFLRLQRRWRLGSTLHRGQETVSRFRPLARRRFRTSRPFLVLIRSRKPCVLRRRLRFGWKVRFIDLAPIHAAHARPQNLPWYLGSPTVSTQPRPALFRASRLMLQCDSTDEMAAAQHDFPNPQAKLLIRRFLALSMGAGNRPMLQFLQPVASSLHAPRGVC